MSKRIAFANVTEETIHDVAYEVRLDGDLVGRVIRSSTPVRRRYSEGRLGRDVNSTRWHYQTLSDRSMWQTSKPSSDSRDRAVQELLVDTRGMRFDEAAGALGKPVSWA